MKPHLWKWLAAAVVCASAIAIWTDVNAPGQPAAIVETNSWAETIHAVCQDKADVFVLNFYRQSDPRSAQEKQILERVAQFWGHALVIVDIDLDSTRLSPDFTGKTPHIGAIAIDWNADRTMASGQTEVAADSYPQSFQQVIDMIRSAHGMSSPYNGQGAPCQEDLSVALGKR